MIYALASSSTKSFSFDLCDLEINQVSTDDDFVRSVRMSEPGATVRGRLLSDFSGVAVETMSMLCTVELFTVRSAVDELIVNCLASATASIFNQRQGMWQVLCSVPTVGTKYERNPESWRVTCEALQNERINVTICDAFLNTLSQTFTSEEGTICAFVNRSGVTVAFAVADGPEQTVKHGDQCSLLAGPIERKEFDQPVFLTVRPESGGEVAKLPLTETNEFAREFTTNEGKTFSIMTSTELRAGAIHVTCRSLIEIENTGAVAVDIHAITGGEVHLAGTATQGGERLSVVQYNESTELRLALQGGVRVSSPFVVGGLSSSSQTVVLPGENGRPPQFFQIDVLSVGEASLLVRVSAAFCVDNLLPFDCSFSVIESSSDASRHQLVRATSGSRADLYNCSSFNCNSFMLQIVPAENTGYGGGTVRGEEARARYSGRHGAGCGREVRARRRVDSHAGCVLEQ